MLRLGSGSPRRIELLRLVGLPFEIVPANIDETLVASPAEAKAALVSRPGAVTLAADTEVLLDGEPVGKPSDAEHALAMLRRLAGRGHDVNSEIVVVNARGTRLRFAVTSRVRMRAEADVDLAAYARSEEPLDKAGAYAIQGAGRALVASYDGCFANITGMPLCHVYFALRRAGIASRERPERVCQERFDFACPVWRAAQRQGRALRDGGVYRSWDEDVAER